MPNIANKYEHEHETSGQNNYGSSESHKNHEHE